VARGLPVVRALDQQPCELGAVLSCMSQTCRLVTGSDRDRRIRNGVAVTGAQGHVGPHWRKSSFSAENGNCVEVAELPDQTIGVRDSKDNGPGRPTLTLTFDAWSSFIIGVQRGEFDLP
jgi:Domain of unknown function (DUF397)